MTEDDLNALTPQTVRLTPALYPDVNGVAMTFDAVTGATGYDVLRGTSAAGPFTAVTGGTGLTDTSFVDDSLPAGSAGQTFYYVVRAHTDAGTTDTAPVAYVAGSGLLATHYETEFFQDNPDNDTDPHVRTDNTMDENWGDVGPDYLAADPSSADPDDTWSIVFNGRIRPPTTGDWTFQTGSDDGIDIQIVDPDTGAVLLQGPPGGINFLRGIAYPFQDTVGTVEPDRRQVLQLPRALEREHRRRRLARRLARARPGLPAHPERGAVQAGRDRRPAQPVRPLGAAAERRRVPVLDRPREQRNRLPPGAQGRRRRVHADRRPARGDHQLHRYGAQRRRRRHVSRPRQGHGRQFRLFQRSDHHRRRRRRHRAARENLRHPVLHRQPRRRRRSARQPRFEPRPELGRQRTGGACGRPGKRRRQRNLVGRLDRPAPGRVHRALHLLYRQRRRHRADAGRPRHRAGHPERPAQRHPTPPRDRLPVPGHRGHRQPDRRQEIRRQGPLQRKRRRGRVSRRLVEPVDPVRTDPRPATVRVDRDRKRPAGPEP